MLTPSGSHRRPVVLVHGIWNTAAIFNPLKAHLTAQGHPVYALSMTPNDGALPLEHLAHQLADFVQSQVLPENSSQQGIHFIGFSMGGLIARYYLQVLKGTDLACSFISICAPHHGTALAFGARKPGVCQMRPGSDFLRMLDSSIHTLQLFSVFSLWTCVDMFILPPWSAQLPVGQNIRLPVKGHNQMIRDRRSLDAIAALLNTVEHRPSTAPTS